MEVITPHNSSMESIPGIPAGRAGSMEGGAGPDLENGRPGRFPRRADRRLGQSRPRPAAGRGIPALGQVCGARILRDVLLDDAALADSAVFASRTRRSTCGFTNTISTNANGPNHVYALTACLQPPTMSARPQCRPRTFRLDSQGFTAFDPNHWNDDRMQQWTFVVERELSKNDARHG